MDAKIIQDWTRASGGETLTGMEYRVIRTEDLFQQEIRDNEGKVLGSFQLPEGVRMDRQSLEVMLRYALTQIAA